MNYISKLFMNSLYGRFGMDNNFSWQEIMILNEKQLNKMTDDSDNIYKIKDIINFFPENDYLVVQQL